MGEFVGPKDSSQGSHHVKRGVGVREREREKGARALRAEKEEKSFCFLVFVLETWLALNPKRSAFCQDCWIRREPQCLAHRND